MVKVEPYRNLDSWYATDDTCAGWWNQLSEEANAKKSRLEEASRSTLGEACECQAPRDTTK
jgi:hypothetical protein